CAEQLRQSPLSPARLRRTDVRRESLPLSQETDRLREEFANRSSIPKARLARSRRCARRSRMLQARTLQESPPVSSGKSAPSFFVSRSLLDDASPRARPGDRRSRFASYRVSDKSRDLCRRSEQDLPRELRRSLCRSLRADRTALSRACRPSPVPVLSRK